MATVLYSDVLHLNGLHPVVLYLNGLYPDVPTLTGSGTLRKGAGNSQRRPLANGVAAAH